MDEQQVIVKMTMCSTVCGRTTGHCEKDQVHYPVGRTTGHCENDQVYYRVWTNSQASCAQAFHGLAVPDSTGT